MLQTATAMVNSRCAAGFRVQVQANTISNNGGFGNRLVDGETTLDTVVQLTAPAPTSQVFGVGVYLESAQGNVGVPVNQSSAGLPGL